MEISSRYAIYQELTALEVDCISITNVQEKRSDLQLPEAGGGRRRNWIRSKTIRTSNDKIIKYGHVTCNMIAIVNVAVWYV